MRKISISLTPRYRLDIAVTKQRQAAGFFDPLLPSLVELKNIRTGSRFSRLFRHIFEQKALRKVLGTNFALMVIASSFVPRSQAMGESEQNIVSVGLTKLTTERNITYPVETIRVTQGYKLFHPGLDLDGVTGDAIHPMMPGTVTEVQHSRFAYGNAVIIDHGHEITTLYAHLSKIEVEVGQTVDVFTKIGEMGATGRAFGDHLHLEVREAGRPVNPLSILPKL